MEPSDFDDILKETEIDTAKMVFRLSSELKDRDTEIANLRSKSFEEIQRNNKAKEAEFEALIKAQETRIKQREQEISQLLVSKESKLWNKYQQMLDSAINKHRAELEDERERLHRELEKKENQLNEQRKTLHSEMEDLFKKWEGEREEQFKIERETFINELKLGRDTAKKEGDGKIEHINKIWQQKLRQKEEELKTKYQLELEELQGQLNENHLKQTKTLTDKLNSEFKKREEELTGIYKNWLNENKNLSKEEQENRVWKVETEYKKQTRRLSEMLREAKEELKKSELESEKNLLAIKQHYQKKEDELKTIKIDFEINQKNRENTLEERYSNRETELFSRINLKTEELKNKEKALEDAYGARIKDLSANMEEQNKRLEEQKQKLKREEQNLKNFKDRISNILKEREAELETNTEQRYLLLKQSLEESFALKEKNLSKKSEDIHKQSESIETQKSSMLETIQTLEDKNKKLELTLKEAAQNNTETLNQKDEAIKNVKHEFEIEFNEKTKKLDRKFSQKDEELERDYQRKFDLEESRLSERLKIKEQAIEKQKELLITQAAKLEEKFLNTLKEKELETAKSFKRTIETLSSRSLKEQETHSLAMDVIKSEFESELTQIKTYYEALLNEKSALFKNRSEEIEKTIQASFDETLKEEQLELKTQANLQAKEFGKTNEILREKNKSLANEKDMIQEEKLKLKESMELLNIKVDEMQDERQSLIRENS